MKYGKAFAEAARNNQLEYPAKVSAKLIAKLSVQAPPKLLVERLIPSIFIKKRMFTRFKFIPYN